MKINDNQRNHPLTLGKPSDRAVRGSSERAKPPWRSESAEVVLHSLFSTTGQELAELLREVPNGAATAEPGISKAREISELLVKAVRLAAKQFLLQEELKELALRDKLTGFYNRRSFYVLAERQWKLAVRASRGMLLFFVDVDGLKEINDSYGHAQGDRALKRTAQVLERTFRRSDVMARLGGDEFAVLAVEAAGQSEARILARLRRYLEAANAKESPPQISLSIGVARLDHQDPAAIEELVASADRAMYEQKHRRSRA